jgi:DNA-binding MarR family transcriptional regulator
MRYGREHTDHELAEVTHIDIATVRFILKGFEKAGMIERISTERVKRLKVSKYKTKQRDLL